MISGRIEGLPPRHIGLQKMTLKGGIVNRSKHAGRFAKSSVRIAFRWGGRKGLNPSCHIPLLSWRWQAGPSAFGSSAPVHRPWRRRPSSPRTLPSRPSDCPRSPRSNPKSPVPLAQITRQVGSKQPIQSHADLGPRATSFHATEDQGNESGGLGRRCSQKPALTIGVAIHYHAPTLIVIKHRLDWRRLLWPTLKHHLVQRKSNFFVISVTTTPLAWVPSQGMWPKRQAKPARRS